MSDKKITELADGGAVQSTDEFVVARAGGNVKIAGSAIGTGGSSAPVNWAVVRLTAADAMTVAASEYDYQLADLEIIGQSGSDFSLGEVDRFGGALMTAGGGVFQSIAYLRMGSAGPVTLDGGSAAQRIVSFGVSLGPTDSDDPNQIFSGVGMDDYLPVRVPSAHFVVRTVASVAGYVPAGDAVLWGAFTSLVDGFGTDAVTADPWDVYVWQTGTLT